MAARYPNAPRWTNHRRNFAAYPRNSRSHPKFKVVNNQAGGASGLSFNMTCASPKLRSTFEINKMQKRLCNMLHVPCGSRNGPGRGFRQAQADFASRVEAVT